MVDDTFDYKALKKAMELLKKVQDQRKYVYIIPRGYAEAHGIEEDRETIFLSDHIDCSGIRIKRSLLELKWESKPFKWED